MSSRSAVSKNPNTNWHNNAIQFPRLIAELEAVGAFTPQVSEALCVEMDLTMDELDEIVFRAQQKWDSIKAQL